MSPHRLAATLLFVASACSDPAPPPPAPSPPPPPPVAAPPPKPVDPPPPELEPSWKPPLDAAGLAALDHYAAFSGDGLIFAYSEPSIGAGVPVISFMSATTSTIEKVVPLASKKDRETIAAELSEEVFPKPGFVAKIPDVLGTVLNDGQVLVTFSRMPAGRPYAPFGKGAVAKASVVAVSHDGKRVAVKASAKNPGGEFGAAQHWRVVTLFE